MLILLMLTFGVGISLTSTLVEKLFCSWTAQELAIHVTHDFSPYFVKF